MNNFGFLDTPYTLGGASLVIEKIWSKIKQCAILCHPSQKRCYWANDGQEINTGIGIDSRVLGSAAININNDILYITGGFGFNGVLNSTEIHAFQEVPKIGPELPFPTSDHCLVQIDINQFMLIGFDNVAKENR